MEATEENQSSEADENHLSKSEEQHTSQAEEQQPSEAEEQHMSKSEEQHTSQAEEQQPSEAEEQHMSKSEEQHTSQADEQQPSEAEEQHKSKSEEQHTSQADEQHTSQADEQHTSKSDEQHTSQADEQHTSKSDEHNTSQADEQHTSHAEEQHASKLEEPMAEAEETSPDIEEPTVGSEAMDDHMESDPMDSEEQLMMNEENHILYEKEQEETLVVQGVGLEEMEPPETKEIIPEEEPTFGAESAKEGDDTGTQERNVEGELELDVTIEDEDKEAEDNEEDEGDDKFILNEEDSSKQADPEHSRENPQPEMVTDKKPEVLKPLLKPAHEAGSEETTVKLTLGKPKKTEPRHHGARKLHEDSIEKAIKTPAPKHDYFGLIFSAESKRPPAFYHNYFLPSQKQPHSRQHMKVLGQYIPYEAVKPYTTVPPRVMPLSTIKVRWMLHRRNTVYSSEYLYAYLTSFGPIERIYQLSSNSALVVFNDLTAAQTVVTTAGLGYPWDPLIADWLEPRMNNHGYYRKYALIEESPDRATETDDVMF